MIRSMTGFGRGEYVDEVRKITVEIRTVNHRYLDIYIKMPRKYSFAEEKIKALQKDLSEQYISDLFEHLRNLGMDDKTIVDAVNKWEDK